MGDNEKDLKPVTEKKEEEKKDKSIADAKDVAIDFAKQGKDAMWGDWVKGGKPLPQALENWANEGLKDVAKTAVTELNKQASTDPMSPNYNILSLFGAGFYSPMEKDIYEQIRSLYPEHLRSTLGYDLSGKNINDVNRLINGNKEDKPDKEKKSKGFDFSPGAPNVGVSLKGDWMDLAKKGPGPATIKEAHLSEKISLSYKGKIVDLKASVELAGSMKFENVKEWKEVNKKLFEKQGQGSVTVEGGVDFHPDTMFKVSVNGGTTFSSQLNDQNGNRKNDIQGHVNVQVEIQFPEKNKTKREDLLKNENPPAEKSKIGGKELDAAEKLGPKIELPKPDKPK